MITHQKLVEIVEEALEVPSGTISNQENNNWAEKWDSLGHLSILIKLDKYSFSIYHMSRQPIFYTNT